MCMWMEKSYNLENDTKKVKSREQSFLRSNLEI